jgi:hypothetical protein
MNHSMANLVTLLVCISSVCDAAPHGSIAGRSGYGGMGDPLQTTAQSDYWEVWRGIKISAASLSKTIGATNSEAGLLLRQIQTNAQFLDGKWNAWFKAHNEQNSYAGPDAYLAGLRADNRLLNNLRKEKDVAKILDGLRDAALDMQIKSDNCRHSGDGLGKEIGVKVHTKAGENEVGGYEVFFVQKGMFDVKSAHDRFPRKSSPTDEKILCPGGYAMWVRKKNFTSAPVILRIGGRGEVHLEVDIEVPAD